MVEVKVVGMKVPADQTHITKGKKTAIANEMGKASPPQTQKETGCDKEKPLSDISEKINVGLEKMTVDTDSQKSPAISERPKREKAAQDNSTRKPGLGSERGKPGKKKNAVPAVREGKRTRQTQLNFAGSKKMSAVAAASNSKTQAEEKNIRRRSVSDMDVTADEVEMDKPKPSKVPLQTGTELMDLENEMCEVQVLNESTPQVNLSCFFTRPLSTFSLPLCLSSSVRVIWMSETGLVGVCKTTEFCEKQILMPPIPPLKSETNLKPLAQFADCTLCIWPKNSEMAQEFSVDFEQTWLAICSTSTSAFFVDNDIMERYCDLDPLAQFSGKPVIWTPPVPCLKYYYY